MIDLTESEVRITTACILAAGTGSRLQPLTDCQPKCLTEIHGLSILERLVASLRTQGFTRLVFVVGHLEACIRDSLELHARDMTIEFVSNPVFATTNNLYSLWLARHYINEPFLLIESDLIFDAPLLDGLSYPDRIAVSNRLPWMNGTTVNMTASQRVSKFCLSEFSGATEERFKTVNICSFSAASWRTVVARLDQFVAAGRVTEYYEAVFEELVAEGSLDFLGVMFDENRWYEVDTIDDLRNAHVMFANAVTEAPALSHDDS